MTPLRVVSGRQCMRALERAGFRIIREESSHVVMRRDAMSPRVIVPDHKVVKPGTLRAIIRDSGLTVDEFNSLLR